MHENRWFKIQRKTRLRIRWKSTKFDLSRFDVALSFASWGEAFSETETLVAQALIDTRSGADE